MRRAAVICVLPALTSILFEGGIMARERAMPPTGTQAQAQQAAAGQKQQPPSPGPIRPFKFPTFETRKLANGLTVFVIEDHRQPLVSYGLRVNAGGIAHPPSKAGLASLTAELLRQGTDSRSAQDIARAIDSVGGELRASADDDTAEVRAMVVKSAADLALNLLADIVLHPAFRQEEIDRLRRQTLSTLQVKYADAGYLAPLVAARATFGEHPYGFPVDGTPETLQAITRDDIVKFHGERYAPAGAYLAVSGDISPAAAFAQIEKKFGSWSAPASAPVSPPAPPPSAHSVLLVDKPDAVQTQIVVTKLGVKRNDPDYFALVVANQIFGGSASSRLNMKLRAQEGLTYGARSSFQAQREAGAFEVSTSTRTGETGKVVGLVLDLLSEFKKNPATEAELKEAKAFLAGSFVIASETPAQVADRVLAVAKYGLPADYWDTYRDKIQAVTAAQIAAAVTRHIDPDRMTIVAVGNTKEFIKSLEPLGQVRSFPFAELDVTRPDLRRAAAAPVATPAAMARGKALIKAAADAVGGPDKLISVKDIVSKGNMSVAGPAGEMKGDALGELVYPDKIKMTISLPMGQMIQAFDGKEAWMQAGGRTMTLPPMMNDEMKRTVLLSAGVGVLREALAGRAEVQALEPADAEGRKLEVVNWTCEGKSVKLFFDPDTHLLARVAYRSISPQGAADVESHLSDYRDVGGVKVPWRIVTYRSGQKLSETILEEAKLNTGLNLSGFSKPSAAP